MIIGYGSITITSLVDIESSTWYYTLSSSTPAKPTQNADPPSGWNKTEPSYTEGSALNLYIVNKIVYGDGTFEYSDVSLSSSYKAAKTAYEKVNSLEIGGRNLILDSATPRVSPESNNNSAYVSPVPTLTAYGNTLLVNTTDWFTYSFDYEVTGNSDTGAFVYGQMRGSSIPSASIGYSSNVYDNPTGKYCAIFKLNSTQAAATSLACGVRLRNATNGAILTISNIKLEKGNKATDWSPAPEDVTAYTDAAQAAAQNYADGTQAAAQSYADNAVANVQVGGKNLLACINSKLPRSNGGLDVTLEEDGWIRVSGTCTNSSATYILLWGGTSVENALFPNLGQCTFSVEDDGVVIPNTVEPQMYYVSDDGETALTAYATNGSVTRTIYSVIRICLVLRGNASGTVVNGRIRFKLEKGNKATDWSPAPEDIVAESVESIQVGGRNLYAVCNEVEGFIASGGTITAASENNERTSGYIPVSEGDRYVLQSWVPSIPSDKQSWIGYHFYSDTSGTKVGSRTSKYSENGGTYLCYDDITVPEGAAYIRVFYRHYEDGYCKLETGNKPTDWTPAPEDVTNYTDETVDASQVMMAKQNLSPFFSYALYANGNYYYANDNYYWRSVSKTATSGYIVTSMGDGWVRVQKDNTSGSSNSYHGFIPFNNDLIKPGAEYTFLFEFRNNNSTGTGFGNNFYIVQLNNTQFWGAGIRKNLSGARTTANVNLIADFPPGTSGVYEKRFVKASEPTGSSHWTGALNSLVYVRAGCAPGDTLDCEIRMSLYEGEYTGPYKPYGVDVGDFAGVKTTANTALTTANGKNKVVYSTTQPSGVFVAGDTWFNTSTSGADAGKISKWNGSDWVAQEIGSASILANEALMNKLFAYDVTAANCITSPILISSNYNGTIDRTQARPTYDNNNTAGSIFNLYEGKINIGGSLKYDSTNGLVLDGDLTATNGTITGATLDGAYIMGQNIIIKATDNINDINYISGITVLNETDEFDETLQLCYTHINSLKTITENSTRTYYRSSINVQPESISLGNSYQVYNGTIPINNVMSYISIYDEGITIVGEYVYINANLEEKETYTSFSGNVVSNSTVVVVKKLGWCQVFGALRPTSSAADFVTILDSTKVPAPQHGVPIYEQAQYWYNGYTMPLRIRINALGGLDVCKGYVDGAYGFSITYPIK